jgi:hypothetical protein
MMSSSDRYELERSNAQLARDIMRIRAATVFVVAFGILFAMWWLS